MKLQHFLMSLSFCLVLSNAFAETPCPTLYGLYKLEILYKRDIEPLNQNVFITYLPTSNNVIKQFQIYSDINLDKFESHTHAQLFLHNRSINKFCLGWLRNSRGDEGISPIKIVIEQRGPKRYEVITFFTEVHDNLYRITKELKE